MITQNHDVLQNVFAAILDANDEIQNEENKCHVEIISKMYNVNMLRDDPWQTFSGIMSISKYLDVTKEHDEYVDGKLNFQGKETLECYRLEDYSILKYSGQYRDKKGKLTGFCSVWANKFR